jgi:hypothetical protein
MAMITKLTLNEAVSKVYGDGLIACPQQSSEWQMFTPFRVQSSGSTVLLRLLEVPAYLYTSE